MHVFLKMTLLHYAELYRECDDFLTKTAINLYEYE